nr:hypothetical protein [Tanacetum cinerariifolium]
MVKESKRRRKRTFKSHIKSQLRRMPDAGMVQNVPADLGWPNKGLVRAKKEVLQRPYGGLQDHLKGQRDIFQGTLDRRNELHTGCSGTEGDIGHQNSATAPPCPSLIETPKKENLDMYCDYHREKGHNTNDCYQLKRKLEAASESGKLSRLVKYVRQQGNNIERQPRNNNDKGKVINMAEVEGYLVRRVFVDQGAAVQVMFEHCFDILPPPIKARLTPTHTQLVDDDEIHGGKSVVSMQHHTGAYGDERAQEKKKTEQEENREEAEPEEHGESKEEKVLAHPAFSEQKVTIGIKANPKKKKAVADMQSPKTLKEMQSLSGKLSALNRFLSRSAERALPFFETLKKITKENKEDYRWTEDAERAFQEIRKLIIELPTLTTSIPKETLYVYLAASRDEVSGVLVADRNEKQTPIRYFEAHPIKVLAGFINEVPTRTKHLEIYSLTDEESLKEWTLYTDEASSLKGVGAGLVLIDPARTEYTYAIWLTFPSTNNEAVYEALLVDLQIVHKMKVQALK